LGFIAPFFDSNRCADLLQLDRRAAVNWLGGILLYAWIIRSARGVRVDAFCMMIVLLTLLWIVSLRGDPPPSLKLLAIVNTVFFAVVEAWAYCIDRTSRYLLGH